MLEAPKGCQIQVPVSMRPLYSLSYSAKTCFFEVYKNRLMPVPRAVSVGFESVLGQIEALDVLYQLIKLFGMKRPVGKTHLAFTLY